MTHSMKQTEVPIISNRNIKISHFVLSSIYCPDFFLETTVTPHNSDFSYCTQTVTVSHAHSPTSHFSHY